MRGSRDHRARGACGLWAGLCCALLLLSASGTAARATLRVVEQSTATSTLVRVTAPESSVGDYLDRFAVAVGEDGRARLRVLELRMRPLPIVPPASPRIDAPRLGPPQRVRHSWLRHVDIPRYVRSTGGEWREVESVLLSVEHSGLARAVAGLTPEQARLEAKVLGSAVVNREVFESSLQRRALQNGDERTRRAPIVDTFARSPRWVRLEVDRGGIYRLDAADLRTAIGDEVDVIDVATLRVFSAPTSRVSPDVLDPESSWREGYALRERALRVESTGGMFGTGDSIWFFTGGPDDWRDRFDPSADLWAFDDRLTSDRIALWLTYDRLSETSPSSFPSAPLRMVQRDATPTGGARVVSTARSRLHLEQNNLAAFGRLQDNWAWRDRIEQGSSFRHFLDLPHAVTDSAGWLEVAPAMDPPRGFLQTGLPDHRLQVAWNSASVAQWTWTLGQQNSESLAPLRFRVNVTPMLDGMNDLTLTNTSASQDSTTSGAPQLIVDEFSVVYRRQLELDGEGLNWIVPPGEAAQASRFEFRLSDGGQGLGEAVVLDVTDPWSPQWLDGSLAAAGAELNLETAVAPSGARFSASFRATALRPVVVRAQRPRRLREEVSSAVNGGQRVGYDMVILHPASLAASAGDLAAYRRIDLDGTAGARVAAVDLQDVYDQFGAGTKDPVAIRNYLKFLFEADSRLRYVLLFGDGNRDARGVIQNSDPDLCPAWVQTHWPRSPIRDISLVAYARDDLFVSFDAPPDVPGSSVVLDAPDVAIGRLPVTNLSEARQIVRRIIDYESSPASGTWRNTMLLAADDEVGLAGPNYREVDHVRQAERIRKIFLPPALDVDQLYLTEFPTVPGTRGKPSARQEMRARWSSGRLIVHYIGHGSPEQMADENLFRIEDVSSLSNDRRRSLFVAFSCDVSIFDDPIKRSMSEQLVLSDTGGSIATIAATQVTFIGPNNIITDALYPNLFPSPILGRSQPVGSAIWRAKVETFSGGPFTQHNSSKYVLLGDPSLRLESPRESLALSGSLAQGVVSGQLVDLQVDSGGLAGSGRWYVTAAESADSVSYYMNEGPASLDPDWLDYQLTGAPFFRGEGQFEGGSLRTQLRTPAFLEFGDEGRVRVVFEEGSQQWVGVADSLSVTRGVPDTDDSEGPTIELAFANQSRRVTPGMSVSATISDSSGINVLGTVPANSILLEFDDSGVQSNVTDQFVLDADDFRRGTIAVTLPPTIEPGEHTLALSAGDMMSNVSTARTSFEVVAEGQIDIGDHTPYPNPFREQTRFVLEVIAPIGVTSDIELSVFAVDGQRVRTLRDRLTGGGGRLSIPWDGRDGRGGEVANGTYLYTVRVDFTGARVASQTASGRVVRMR